MTVHDIVKRKQVRRVPVPGTVYDYRYIHLIHVKPLAYMVLM